MIVRFWHLQCCKHEERPSIHQVRFFCWSLASEDGCTRMHEKMRVGRESRSPAASHAPAAELGIAVE
jgi:hypothetical protein